MPPHDASNRNSDAWARLRQYVEKASDADPRRARPGVVSCKRPVLPAVSAYEDEDDGPITTRWAAG